MIVNVVFTNDSEVYYECIFVKETESYLKIVTAELIDNSYVHTYPISMINEWSVMGE